MLRFLNVIVLLFVMLSNGHAQSALESSFIDLFTFGSVLDFKGKLQTVTETTEWVGQKKRVKQVCAFDVSGRLVRIFYYENGVYQYLTKIRYHKTTGLPEWLVTNDHKTKSAQRYHLEFNQDLTKAFQYHIDAKQKATLVKSATRQDSQVFVRKDTEQGELVQQFALSPSGRVLSNMQNLGDQVVSRQRTQYNRQGLAQKVTISIGHEVQTAELVHKLDERGNILGQQWYSNPTQISKIVSREPVYFSEYGVCERPRSNKHNVKEHDAYVTVVDIGELSGRRYDNAYFQLHLTVPDGYTVLSDEDRMALMLAKTEVNVDLTGSKKRVLNEFAPDFLTLLHAEYKGASLLLVAQKMSHFPGATNGFDVLCQLKRTAREEKTPVRFINAPYEQQVGGQRFFVNDLWVGKRLQPIAQKKYYVRAVKGYALVFTYTQPATAENDLLGLIEQIEFPEFKS